jgi:hypothetical protein
MRSSCSACSWNTGHELDVVALQVEVEGVLRVLVDEGEVRVRHRQLAEAEVPTPEVHVVGVARVGQEAPPRRRPRSEDLDDVVALDADGGDVAADARRRQHPLGIEDEVVVVDHDPPPGLDLHHVVHLVPSRP